MNKYRIFFRNEMGKTPSFCLQIQQNIQEIKMLEKNYSREMQK